MIAKAREVAQHFGFDTNHADVKLTASVAKGQAIYAREHPQDLNARVISPLSERIEFKSPGGKEAQVGVDSTGLPTLWRPPDHGKSTRKAGSEREQAQAAFAYLAGSEAANFSETTRSMGDEASEEDYEWKKPPAAHSDVRDRIKVTAKNSAVEKAERTISISSGQDIDDETGSLQGYWPFFAVSFWVLCTAGLVGVFALYVLWLTHRSLNHKFPIMIAVAAFVVMGVQVLSHADVSDDAHSFWGALVTALVLMCIVAAGRGIAGQAKDKWMSLEQLCRRAPISKSAGYSLAAGLACGLLLAAVPFLLCGSRLFGDSAVVTRNAEMVYSPVPLLAIVRVPKEVYLLGFFGFGTAALRRMFKRKWLRWTVLIVTGTLFCADLTRTVTGPFVTPTVAGFCIFAIYGFLYRYFDLLAVLTSELASRIVLGMLIMEHAGGSIWPFAAAFFGLLLVAMYFAKSGQPVAEGDPQATQPELSWFRAEREKLQAEFGLARRAQEGMLPQVPPEISGYSIAASCTPSLEVGGDLYDFLKLPDGRFGFGVADVSGKGVPAALYMTLTKGLLSSVSQDSAELATVATEVNRHLYGVTRKKVFVTMAIGFLDAERKQLECVRAGHNPIVWRQASKDVTTLVSPKGLGLGIAGSRVFASQLRVEELNLTDGNVVVFYSDGITEAMNRQLEQFGEERLMEAVTATDGMDATQTRDFISQAVRKFLDGVHPQDDMTLVVLRVGSERMMVRG